MILSTVDLNDTKEVTVNHYPEKHILAGLPLFTAPIPKEKKEEKTVHLSSINDINRGKISNYGRQLVFAGKVIKKAGEKIPFSMEQLIKTHQAGLV